MKLPETKEEILNFIDNIDDLNSPENLAMRERAKTDENYRNLLKEIRKENDAPPLKKVLNMIKNHVQSDTNISEEVRSERLVETEKMIQKYTNKNK